MVKKRGYSGRNCKRGNAILDGIFIFIIIVVFAIVSIYGSKVFDELNTEIQADADIGSSAKTMSNNLYLKYNPLLDNLIMFAFALFIIFAVISVFLLDTHPIFFVITIMLLVAMFIVSLLMANTFDDIMTDPEISGYANEFNFTTWIMGHLLELSIALGFLVAILTFVKFKA